MPYDFQTSEHDGIFIARIGGERQASLTDKFQELWTFWSGVASEMKQKGLHRLLAVVLVQSTPRSLDVVSFYRRLAEMGFLAHMRLAVVADVPAWDRLMLQLVVDAAAKDGWNMRFFLSEPEAKSWLLES